MSEPETSTEHRPTADRTPTGTPIAEAAARLGVTTDAIRARIRRGTLDGVKHKGAWFVTLPAVDDDTNRTQPDTGRPHDDQARIDDLKGEIDYLRETLTTTIRQLDDARGQAAAERERADVLQREALVRIEALTAGSIDTPEGTGSPPRKESGEQDVSGAADRETPPRGVWRRLWDALRG